jgi:hypothetical protein
MDARFVAPIRADAAQVFAAVEDLGTYPLWLGIVLSAKPAPPDADDLGPAWKVEIGAKVGPFTQSKRLRMARTVHEPVREVTFERTELDGRSHPVWMLHATIDEVGAGAALTMHLHYGGAPPIPFLDQVLAGEARRAARRLEERLRGRPD